MSGGAVDGNRRMVVGDGSLIIGAATTMDAGIYTCVVSGPRGIVMRNVSVQVRGEYDVYSHFQSNALFRKPLNCLDETTW